jgi:hypothetical protein
MVDKKKSEPADKKEKASPKKKKRSKQDTTAEAAPVAGVNLHDSLLTATADLTPATVADCLNWKNRIVRARVFLAIEVWANNSNFTDATPLGSLVPAWNPGEQARLTAVTNQDNGLGKVFAPFDGPPHNSRMAPLGSLLPPATTVAQWTNEVWEQQDPRTPCFGV